MSNQSSDDRNLRAASASVGLMMMLVLMALGMWGMSAMGLIASDVELGKAMPDGIVQADQGRAFQLVDYETGRRMVSSTNPLADRVISSVSQEEDLKDLPANIGKVIGFRKGNLLRIYWRDHDGTWKNIEHVPLGGIFYLALKY